MGYIFFNVLSFSYRQNQSRLNNHLYTINLEFILFRNIFLQIAIPLKLYWWYRQILEKIHI